MQEEALLSLVTEALEELKAVDITVLDVRDITSITDRMVICTGRSNRHVKSIADNLVQKSKAEKFSPLGVQGQTTGQWVVVDLGDVVVHIMQPDVRDFYQLEKLWGTAQTK